MADIQVHPLRGGVDTVRNVVQLDGRFSRLQNMRQRHPAIEQRLGAVRQHTVADASVETISLFGFSKSGRDEIRTLRQAVDGSVMQATNNLPTITTGAFGSDVLAAVPNPLPASYSVIDDMLLFSDGVRQHQILLGTRRPVRACIVNKDTASPTMVEKGEDYSDEAADGLTTTFVILDALAANQFIYVMALAPLKGINFDISTANSNSSVASAKYWKGAWAAVSSFTDGTASGGATLAQAQGAMSWTPQSDEVPHFLFGKSGFWYQIKVGSTLSATVRATQVLGDADFQAIHNVWDGTLVNAVEAHVFTNSRNNYGVFSGLSVNLSGLATTDFVYVSMIDPVSGLYFDPRDTPNNVKNTVTGDSNITFVDNGGQPDYLEARDANLQQAGFVPGMSIVITGTSSNNTTLQVLTVTATRMTFETGTLTTEADTSAVLTNTEAVTALDKVEYWNGDSWVTVGTITDGTTGLTKPGFVTWDRTAITPQPTHFNATQYYAFWYRISFDKALSDEVSTSIQTMPYFNIDELGLGRCNEVWKDRAVYSSKIFPQFAYIATRNMPMMLNGEDFGLLEAGDGRKNPILSKRLFYNEMLTFQAESGEKGGCTTLFEGFSPTTFGKLLLSDRVGIMNEKCAVVVDGVTTATQTDERIQTICFWISRYGIMATDGRVIYIISDDIQNYFDERFTESVRRGYEHKHAAFHDPFDNVIRFALVSGTSATVPNIFPVFDLADKSFSFDKHGTAFSCFATVEAASGDTHLLQMAGGSSDGFVHQVNIGTNDAGSTAIDADAILEIDGGAYEIRLMREVLRCKAQSAGDITRSIAKDGSSTFTHTKTLSMVNSGKAYVRHSKATGNLKGNHLSIRYRNNVVSQTMRIEDVGYEIQRVDNTASPVD